ncbi:MAG TPA: hypothetical protein VFL13_06310, partial [Candidatus Baltobacteraceae bacterium]|nr:hypothetical protein [Candidatus Baltobacteraceae bacterium]
VPLETIQRDYALIFRTNGLVPVDKKTLRDAQEHAAPFWRAVVRDASQLKDEMGASSEMLIAEATHMLEIAARPPRVDKVYYLCEKP